MIKQTGFTLIELMITVAIIGIGSSVAYPLYADYVKKARRSDAVSALSQGSLVMERCRTEKSTYTGCSPGDTTSLSKHYNLSVDVNNTGTSYQLTASPDIASPQYSDDECNAFTLSSKGVKGHTGSATAPSACWRT